MKDRTLEFLVTGDYALFTDPVTKLGGEKLSYPIPTYSALKGIVDSIYWKPSIKWVIDELRVLNPIWMDAKATKTLAMNGESSLSYNTYLVDVAYQVRCHFEFNKNKPNLKNDWIVKKHASIAKRALKNGGRCNIFLGTSECRAFVEPCNFGEGKGWYDDSGEISFGVMFHGFNYPNETGKDILETRLWLPKMVNGYVSFIKPEDCKIVRTIRKMEPE